MADDSSESTPAGTVSKQTGLIIIGGVVGLVLLIAVVTGGGGDDTPTANLGDLDLDLTTSTTTSLSDEDVAQDDDVYDSGLAPFNCAAFLPSDAAAIALETDDPEGRIISTFLFSRGERCVYQDADDDRNYVIVEPGSADDFAVGATRLGADAETVEGVGAVAVWFGGADAGAVSVAEESEYGTVFLRVEFGHPERTDEIRRGHAIDLARRVLLRIPGIDWTAEAEPPPEMTTVVIGPADDAAPETVADHVAHLEARVAAGDVSEAAGLVEVLGYLLDGSNAATVVPEGGLLDDNPTGVVARAFEYLEVATDDEAATIRPLVDQLAVTGDEFPSATPADESAGDAGRGPRPAIGAIAQQGCETWGDTTSCLTSVDANEVVDGLLPDGKYLVSGPEPANQLPGGDILATFDNVLEGTAVAALQYEALGSMRPTLVTLLQAEHTNIVGDVDGGDVCNVAVPLNDSTADGRARQLIALEMARCLAVDNLAGEWRPGKAATGGVGWANPGFLWYLSSVAEPAANLEAQFLSALAGIEIAQPVPARGVVNAFYFASLHGSIGGASSVYELVQQIPVDSIDTTSAALASVPDSLTWLHAFSLTMTDGGIADPFGEQYGNAFQSDPWEVEPYTVYGAEPGVNGVSRIQFNVPAGRVACVALSTESGDGVFSSFRPVDDPDWGSLPAGELRGSSWWVTNSVQAQASASISVMEIVDEGEECDDDVEVESDDLAPDPIQPEACPLNCAPSRMFGGVEIPTLFDNNPALATP